MNLRTAILFIIPSLIWGSTWYVIKFQLGIIDPLVSVANRFLLAGIILMVFCKLKGLKLKFSPKEHLFMVLLGICLFGLNYWFVYQAETILTSGLVAIFFSLMIFSNIFLNALLLKGSIKKQVLLGAIMGIGGTLLIFKNEFLNFSWENNSIQAVVMCLTSLLFASMGNIISAFNQKQKMPVVQTNAFAMIYGSLIMYLIVLIMKKEIGIDWSLSYMMSLGYLAIFGSVIAFSAYLKLLGEIGPDRSAYVTLITPVIALIISGFLEDYQWKLSAFLGVLLLLGGNMIALKNKLKLKTKIA